MPGIFWNQPVQADARYIRFILAYFFYFRVLFDNIAKNSLVSK